MKTRIFPSVLVCSVLVAVLALIGCGGGGSSNSSGSGSGSGSGGTGGGSTAVISVSLSPGGSQTLHEGQVLIITATVANDSSNKGVTWGMTGPGSLTNQTSTSVSYNAGTSGTGTATITATSAADTTKSASMSVTVTSSTAALLIATANLPNGQVGVAYNQTISAVGGTAPYMYSVSSGALPTGLSLNSSTGVISGTPTTQQSNVGFTITVTDSTTPTAQTASQAYLLFIVNSSTSLQFSTVQLPAATVNANYDVKISAVGGTSPYTFSLDSTSAALPTGITLASSGILSGTPTSAANVKIVVDVHDSASSPAVYSAVFNLVVLTPCPTGGNLGLLNGQYAFLVQGFAGSETFPTQQGANVGGPFGFIGWFNADGNGNLTAGTEDLDPFNEQRTTSGITSGSYTVGTNNRGCIIFTYGNGYVTVNLNFTASGLNGSGVATNAHFVAVDNSYRSGSGVLRLRTPSAFANGNNNFFGNFAFGMSYPANPSKGRFAAAGMLDLNVNGSVTGVMDMNSAGNINNTGSSNYPATPLTVANPPTIPYSVDGAGRAELSLTTSAGTMDSIMYVISSSDAFIMSIDDQTMGAQGFAGEMLQQGTLSSGSLSGNAIFAAQGAASSGTSVNPEVQLGLFSSTISNVFTLSTDTNTGGVLGTSNQTGDFAFAATGRISLNNAGANPPILYLINPNQAFVLGTDSSAAFGYLQPQSGTPYTAVSGQFAFGAIAPLTASVPIQAGFANFTNGTLTETIDEVSAGGILNGGQTLNGTYSLASSGRGTITNTNGSAAIFYMISPTTAYLLDSTPTDSSPFFGTAEQ